jgi:hypothetical protein
MKLFMLVLSIVVVYLLAFTSSQAQELTDDLVLALSFEEGAGDKVKDMSEQGNDGKIVGNPNWIDGKLGGALYFDGETYVVAPHIPFNEGSYTIQLWVKPEIVSDEVVFSQYEQNAANLSLHLRIQSSGVLLFGFYSNDLETPAVSVNRNEWRNLTFSFNAEDKMRKIYVDGQEVASGISSSAYLGDIGDIWIGGWERPTKPEHPFYQIYHGVIDEVRVWHRVLNEDEIISSMETEMPVDPSNHHAATWGSIKLGL